MLKKCHFIGIGGSGMSALARMLLQRGCRVSGSDLSINAVAEALISDGATIEKGHDARNIAPDMTVVYTTGIKEENPEFIAAQKYGCHILHRSQLLHALMDGLCALAVAGTHGKTTTSSLLAWVLTYCRESPSYAIGGVIPQLGANAAHGTGRHFVFEACESDGSFLNYHPTGAIVTNIDLDHMDYYGTKEKLTHAYMQFMKQVKHAELLFWCHDDPYLRQLALPGISYGFGKDCVLRGLRFGQKGWSVHFDVSFKGHLYKDVEVSLSGRHNALNALAVFGVAISLGLNEKLVREALKTFKGPLRRCEKKGETHNILFLDDYAHHPTEIRATLDGIRQAIGEKRLVVAYQPHRYSRAKECMGLYTGAFDSADALFVSEIYGAGEEPIPGVTHEKVIAEIREDFPECLYVPRVECAKTLGSFLRPHDVLVTLGAGDITKLCTEVMSEFKLKEPSKLRVGIIFGGQSVEHEVSMMSAKYIADCLKQEVYETCHLGITRNGDWVDQKDILDKQEVILPPGQKYKISSAIIKKLLACDILFPVLHGTYGEDGTIQGFFDILGKAYVGCDHRSSAVCMDKALTKRLMVDAGILTSPFLSFSYSEWKQKRDEIIESICKMLVWPIFVKPVHLGSSVGVHKIKKHEDLIGCVDDAFRFDTMVLVENGIVGREIEFAVLGNDEIVVFPPGEICTSGNVYDYQMKYGQNAMKTIPQAELSDELIEEGREIAKKAYLAAGCQGMARVDTFLDKDGTFWLNEINPIPGFTRLSLFPQMCIANGLSGSDLVNRLVILGLHRKRAIEKLEL